MLQHSYKTIFVLLIAVTLFQPISVFAAKNSNIGALYTMTNAADGNAVKVFSRDKEGNLTFIADFSTEGLGTGTGLGNQGAVILDPANRWLFVVNPGSDDISVFAVSENELSLVDRTASNGHRPVSLTFSRNLLFVLNAGGGVGGSDTISGFVVNEDGKLSSIDGSTLPLSADSTRPAQIQFNSDGDVLVVTEKATNTIDTFTVNRSGIPSGPASYPSIGTTPFGFAFGKRDQLFVSEAAGGAQDQSSVSSYHVGENGILNTISPSIGTTETAACWVVVSQDGRFAYTTNAGSGTVSAYRISFDGNIALLDRNGRSGSTGKDSTPIDMAVSNDGHNLYTLNTGNHTISVFRIKRDGSLEKMNTVTGLLDTENGLAAR